MELRSVRGLVSLSLSMCLVLSCAAGSDDSSGSAGSGGTGATSSAGSSGSAAAGAAGSLIVPSGGSSGFGTAGSSGAGNAGSSGAATGGSAGSGSAGHAGSSGSGGTGGSTGCTICPIALTRFVLPTSGNQSTDTATVNITWSATKIEFVVSVKDTTVYTDGPNPWDDDAVEIYLDMNHDKSATFETNDDVQLVVRRSNATLTGLGTFTAANIGVTRTEITGGYTVDVSIPWSALNNNLPSQLGKTIGFDVAVDDDLNGAARDAQLMLYSSDQAFANTSAYGSLTLN